MTLPTPPPTPHAPKLPSPKVSAVLATAVLAAGIALGALLGPAPVASLSAARAAAVGRALVLLALGSTTGSGGELLAAGVAAPGSTQPAASPSAATAATGHGRGRATGALEASTTSPTPPSSSSPSSHSRPSASSEPVSPTPATKPAGGGGEGEERPVKPLAPVASAWVIVLPSDGPPPVSLESALKQPAVAPYLAQLRAQGTVLSGYSPLAVAQLAGAATLLSGQVGPSVVTLSPPPPTEPASVQADDAYLQAVVPSIVATPAYTEHGLIAIAFAPPASGPAASGPAYPAGTLATTVSAAGAPGGVLLLSPFLRHRGGRVTSAFDPASPRVSLEGLLAPPTTTHK